MIYKGKNILIGITGGIACYKICDLIRLLVKENFNVDVIMTESSQKFITPLTIQTLTGNPVYTDMFSLIWESKIGHISLAQKADLIVIAPATANIIGKIAGGICDDLLTTTICATKANVLFIPSMNINMWENPIVQENISKVKRFYKVMEPEEGLLACGDYGKGKLPSVEDILEEIKLNLSNKLLKGKKLLVTAGPTIEELDPVRYISNYSSGKMGYNIAKVAKRLGADVTLISGPVSISKPYGIKTIFIKSADDMYKEVMKDIKSYDIIIMSAAVADYKPLVRADKKIKKSSQELTIELIPNKDILSEISKKRKKGSILVGFSAETDNLIDNAKKKFEKKNLDFIVANNVLEEGAGFGVDTNKAIIIGKDLEIDLPLMSKEELSYNILKTIVEGGNYGMSD